MAQQRLPKPRSTQENLRTSLWSQKDVQEACLMRYFVDELAQWFDTCDPSKHFAKVVPQRAANCPALLYAIFSASARHLSRSQYLRTNEVLCLGKKLPFLGDEAALEYQSLCISHLMSLSGNPAEVADENLLAAAVILRFYEEVDLPLVGVDDETYLRGVQVFLDAQGAVAVRDGGLRLAAFWVGIRQEFHTSFIKQRIFQFDLSCCDHSTYRLLDQADDPTWANRVILHCAHTLMYCYDERSHTMKEYEQLWDYNQGWNRMAPPTFNPIYLRQPDRSKDEVFPELWFLDDCIVTAIQHWHLARILLTAFDPRVPRLGPGRRAAVGRREAEIKESMFILCGIARSNKTAPALITACMGVSMCGDRITDRLEQEALLGILTTTEETHALSTTKAQVQLREAWGWIHSDGEFPSTKLA
ncbi:hypothetical protein BDV32DRAFT_160880 [Aspergillus pseudonomiae]|uniref:Uncharacterized protein n=1 Tax=Aspergillus pseudonomiae TaxID=1506151 RepID=A0A5N6HQV5_9EURO|nr:uncharacterized protein BDV37DRAFT_273388 [Aspergillus pseudonomiae]KAB8256881.1 hypothetical protein BDV32DRAFT_160880 [Aspergillus pseudonomiae]KAE8401812.1 hypothetical protein BDV37DRAFT_273388 [Aspergillus pseudonomiae]